MEGSLCFVGFAQVFRTLFKKVHGYATSQCVALRQAQLKNIHSRDPAQYLTLSNTQCSGNRRSLSTIIAEGHRRYVETEPLSAYARQFLEN